LGVSDLPPHVVHAQAADRCDQLLQGLRRQRAGLAVDRLLHPQTISHLPAVDAAALVGFAGNEAVARYRITVGRRIGSAALVADGLHARTDGFTSLAVLLGAAGVALGFPLADPIIGLVITVAILGVLRSAAREVLARLMDAVDPALVDQAERTLRTTPGVRDVRELRIRWIGHTLRAEADIVVDPNLSLTAAHDLAHHAERHLLAQAGRLSAAAIHTSPTGYHPAAVQGSRSTSVQDQPVGVQLHPRELPRVWPNGESSGHGDPFRR
jgi:cation diffusion facilitator family transporter